jgi:peptidoglycan hydrolase-like protein with peptidoglycan-binding domain
MVRRALARRRSFAATVVTVLLAVACAPTARSAAAPPSAEPRPAMRMWPAPVPRWFWAWARWFLGRGEFGPLGPRHAPTRPAEAPRYVPEWAWRRLARIQGRPPRGLPSTALERGDRGPQVAALQRALNGARFVAGPADGIFGTKTRYGVIAFEQAHGLAPDGVVGRDEFVEIVRALPPDPPAAAHGDAVYVDTARQILFDVRDGDVARVVPVSTGGGYTYTGLDGRPHVAATPHGTFRVQRKVRGRDASYLGTLYFPSYFTNGYAIHGSESVPPRPVSHGCVRIPLYLARTFFRRLTIGTRIVVA